MAQRRSRRAFAITLAERVLTDTCSIQTITKVSDGSGGFTDTISSTVSDCAMLTTGSELEQLVAERLQGQTVATLMLPLTASINHEDKVSKDGNTYHVQSLPGDDTHTVLKQVIVSKVDG